MRYTWFEQGHPDPRRAAGGTGFIRRARGSAPGRRSTACVHAHPSPAALAVCRESRALSSDVGSRAGKHVTWQGGWVEL